jgi:polyphosphate glucokinase
MRGLEKRGKKKWRRHVADVIERLVTALEPDDVVLRGGNVKKLTKLPPGRARARRPTPGAKTRHADC